MKLQDLIGRLRAGARDAIHFVKRGGVMLALLGSGQAMGQAPPTPPICWDPPLEVGIVGLPDSVTLGVPVPVSAAVNVPGNYTFTWIAEGDTLWGNSVQLVFDRAGMKNVQLTVSEGACTQTVYRSLYGGCALEAEFGLSDWEMAPGGFVTLTMNEPGPAPVWTIEPQTPGATITQTGNGAFEFTATQPGLYTINVTVTDPNNPNCFDVFSRIVHVGGCRELDTWGPWSMWFENGALFSNFNDIDADFSGVEVSAAATSNWYLPDGTFVGYADGQHFFSSQNISLLELNMGEGTVAIVPVIGSPNLAYIIAVDELEDMPVFFNGLPPFFFNVQGSDNSYENLQIGLLEFVPNPGGGGTVQFAPGGAPRLYPGRYCDRLAVVPHTNGRDNWLVVQRVEWLNNGGAGMRYESHLLPCVPPANLANLPAPIISTVIEDENLDGNFGLGIIDAGYGQMASHVYPNGNARISTAHYNGFLEDVNGDYFGFLLLCNFDRQNGILTYHHHYNNVDRVRNIVGTAFSPDGLFVFYSEDGNGQNNPSRITQVPLFDDPQDQALAPAISGVLPNVFQGRDDHVGQLQLGPDGTIYAARWRFENFQQYYFDALYNPGRTFVFGQPPVFEGFLYEHIAVNLHPGGNNNTGGPKLPFVYRGANGAIAIPTITGPQTASCGNLVNLEAPACYTEYTWAILSGESMGLANGDTYQITLPSAGTVTVGLTVTDDCGATATATHTIVVSGPLLSLAYANACSPALSHTLTATLNGGTLPFDLSWNGPNAFNGTAAGLNAPFGIAITEGGLYTVTALDQNGCVASASLDAALFVVPPVALADNGRWCLQMPVNISVTNPDPAATYQWSTGATGAVLATFSYELSMAGQTRTVTATYANGCTATAAVVLETSDDCCDFTGNVNWLFLPNEARLSQLITTNDLPTSVNDADNAGAPGSIHRDLIVVTGRLIVDRDYTFKDGTDFCVYPEGEILVERTTGALAHFNHENIASKRGRIYGAGDRLWRGIVVELWLDNNANPRVDQRDTRVTLTHSIISDALVAVDHRGRRANFNASTFVDNFIGFYPHDVTTDGNQFFTNLLQNRCFFRGSGAPLKPTGMTVANAPLPGTSPWVGIWARNLPTPRQIRVVDFENLPNGVRLDNTVSTTVTNCNFSAIRAGSSPYTYSPPVGGPSWDLIEGSAIFALNSTGNLTVGSTQTTNTFTDCDFGVNAWATPLRAWWNVMNGVRRGILVGNGSNRNHEISNNTMTNVREYGVHLWRNSPGATANVYTNTITVDAALNDPTGTYTGQGIRADEVNGKYLLRIVDNTVNVQRASAGIVAHGLDGAYLQENDVRLEAMGMANAEQPAFRQGIQLFVAPQATLNCNSTDFTGINAGGPGYRGTTGIATVLSPAVTLTRNRTSSDVLGATADPLGPQDGLFFMSFCPDATVRGNQFGVHDIGLRLSPTALLGEDINLPTVGNLVHQGNLWRQGNPYAIAGAVHEGSSTQSIEQSQFTVNNANVGAYTLLPTVQLPNLPVGQSATLFSVSQNTCFWPCAADGETDDCTQDFPTGEFGGFDFFAAAGDVQLSQHMAGQNYFYDRYLYAKLLGSPNGVPEGTPLEDFWVAQSSAPIGVFGAIEQGLEQAANLGTEQRRSLDSLSGLLAVQADSLLLLDSLIAAHPTDTLLVAARQQVADAYRQVALAVKAVYDGLEQSLQQSAGLLAAQNASVQALELYEANDVLFNEVHLAVQGSGASAFSPAQVADLEYLAEQCLLAGGPAVAKARALLALSSPRVYADSALCAMAGVQMRQEVPPVAAQLPSLEVYPNPTTEGTVTVALQGAESAADNALVELYDPSGRSLRSLSVGTALQVSLTFEGLSPGLYFVRWVQDGRVMGTAKLVLLR